MPALNRLFDRLRPRSRRGGGNQTVIIVLAVVGGLFFAMLVCGGVLMALLLPAVQAARTAARRTQSSNNLKLLGLAVHNYYYDTNNALPPGGTYAEDGTPHHGWITRLLPFMEEEPLYGQIDFNVPWNDARNDAVFRNSVRVLVDPNIGALNMKDASGYGISTYAGNEQVLGRNKSPSFPEVQDGLSNTALAGTAFGNYKAWGAPDNTRDLTAGLNQTADGFGSTYPAGTQILMMDGSVRTLRGDIDPRVLKAIATPAGNEDPALHDIPF